MKINLTSCDSKNLILNGGTTSEDMLRTIIPKDTPNTFVPSDTIENGYKYNFTVNEKKVQIKWHSADLNAAKKYPGSNSGAGFTAQITVEKKLLGQDGNFYRKPRNCTHIPLIEGS